MLAGMDGCEMRSGICWVGSTMTSRVEDEIEQKGDLAHKCCYEESPTPYVGAGWYMCDCSRGICGQVKLVLESEQ